MADTQTANYKLTKPQNAGSDDTWGDKLNANFDTIDAQMKVTADLVAPGTEPARQLASGRLHLLGLAVPAGPVFSPLASTAYLVPVCQMVKASGITFTVSTINGASSAARISVYESDPDTGLPKALVETLTGANGLNAPGQVDASFSASRMLKPSQWVCFHTNGSVSGSGGLLVGTADPLESSRLFGVASGGTLSTPGAALGLSQALAFGTIAADPFPTGTLALATAVPMLWAKAA